MKRTRTTPTADALAAALDFFDYPGMADRTLQAHRWPNGPTCPRCGSARLGLVVERCSHCCRDCGRVFNVRHGTEFAGGRLSLGKYFVAMWAETGGEPGWGDVPTVGEVSDYELARALGVRRVSAREIRRRLRAAVGGKFGREVGFQAMLDACVPPWPQPVAAARADAAEPAAGPQAA